MHTLFIILCAGLCDGTDRRFEISFKARTFLGVLSEDRIQNGTTYVTIIAVGPKTPAAKAGVQVNDIVVAVDQIDIKSSDHLKEAVQSHQPGEKIILKVHRRPPEGGTIALPVILGQLEKHSGLRPDHDRLQLLCGATSFILNDESR